MISQSKFDMSAIENPRLTSPFIFPACLYLLSTLNFITLKKFYEAEYKYWKATIKIAKLSDKINSTSEGIQLYFSE